MFRSLEKGKFVFQKSLSETPFKPDKVSFTTSNLRRVVRRACSDSESGSGKTQMPNPLPQNDSRDPFVHHALFVLYRGSSSNNAR